MPVTSFADVADHVVRGAVDAGVLPIENVVGGTVVEVEDALIARDLEIVGEVVVPVTLCLAALPGERIEAIERVYSHGQALVQAEAFLRSRPWALLTTYNTAGSGRMVAERRERGSGAILSPRAASLFGLEVLAQDVQSVADNRTRFLVVRPSAGGRALPARSLRRPRADATAAMRTTLVMATDNRPGALHRCLGVFAEAGLNMSRLESRPSRGRAWEYVFWIDLDADARDPTVAAELDRLGEAASMVRVMGSYPRADESAAPGPPAAVPQASEERMF